MIIIKSHFAFSGINIPTCITCSINSYYKDEQFIQEIDFPTTPITEPLGQNYLKSIINNNLKTLDNNLTELRKYPNDHSSQLNITLRSTLDSKEEEFDEPLQNKVNQFVQNFIDNLTKLTELHLITISTGTPLKIYQHPRMGDTLTYHESDFNYYITYSQYLD